MNENEWGKDMQYGNGYDQQYNGQQQYGNGYNQQYNGGQYGYNDNLKIPTNLPEGIASILPEGIKNDIEDKLTEASQKAQNPYEHIPQKQTNAFMRPTFAIVAMIILFIGCFSLRDGKGGILVPSVGVMCVLMGLGIITDKRNSFKRHTKSCVFLIFGIEVILASGYQILARHNPALQPMNGKEVAMASGIIIGSIGPLLLIFHGVNYFFRKKICTQEVQAVCVYVQSRWSKSGNGHSTRIYIPIYEFPYKGNTACIAGNAQHNTVPVVGERRDLIINPDDPTEFYYKNGMPDISVWILAMIVIALGYMLFNSTYKS